MLLAARRDPLRRLLAAVVAAAALGLYAPAPAGAAPEAWIDPVVAHAAGSTSALVHVRAGHSLADAVEAARAAGLRTGSTYRTIGVFVARGRSGAFEELAHNAGIEAVEGNHRVRYFTDRSHEATRGQDLLDGAVTLPDGARLDGSGVGVAIVDSGIDGTHPDLDDRVVSNVKIVCPSNPTSVYVQPVTRPDHCIDPAAKTTIPMEDTDTPSAGGHGTHVAGIVAGTGEASDGRFHGAAPGASLYGVSIGTVVTVENAVDGMQWVLDNHDEVTPNIKVVNNSWGTGTHARYSSAPDHFHSAAWKMQEALVAAGITVVQAAGNTGGDGTAATTTPECVNPTPGVVCVANYYDRDAGVRDGNIDGSSSRGSSSSDFVDTWPDVAAPGTRIISTCRLTLPVCSTHLEQDGHVDDPPNSYARLTGTSMAAPHVAGIVAQLYQADPSLTPARVEDVLEDTAYKFMWGARYAPVDPTNPDDASSFEKGHGLVDARAAVSYLLNGTQPDPDPSPTWTPEPDPTLPPAGPAQTFYFHSTTGLNQADQPAATNTFDGTRPTRLAASSDTPALGPAPHTDSSWTGSVEGPIQSVRLGFWQKTTDESTGSFGVYPFYNVALQVGAGADAERYALGTLDVRTDGTELPATRVSGTFTRHLVADGPDPDGAPDSVPLNVDPRGRPVTLTLSSGWFHGFGAILYDSSQYPSGFSVNAAPSCPEPDADRALDVAAHQTELFLHSASRNGSADAPTGGTTFDRERPTSDESARFEDVPFARNPVPSAPLDPNWGGAIDGAICSLRFDLWQKQALDEAVLQQAHYLATLWVGDRAIQLPPIEVGVTPNSDEATRISFVVDQMLDERGFVLPLMVDAGGEPVSIELAGRYVDGDVSTVVFYDSARHPSRFVVNEGYVARPRPTTLSIEVGGAGAKRTFAATLTDARSGSPIEGETITFLADGREFGTATTDAAGRAVLTGKTPKFPGRHVFEARFDGSESHAPSSSTYSS
jgi:serine protease AprX